MFKKGQFPSDWKQVNANPVHRKNYKQSVINHHPIPLLQICGKIFERLLYNSMFGFFIKNKSPRINLNLDQVALAKTNCCQLFKILTNLLMWA